MKNVRRREGEERVATTAGSDRTLGSNLVKLHGGLRSHFH